MPPTQKSPLNIIFGAMTFGRAGTAQARVTSLSECGAILDIFQAHGHTEIDTARYYGSGTSEEYLGELNWQDRGWLWIRNSTLRRARTCLMMMRPRGAEAGIMGRSM